MCVCVLVGFDDDNIFWKYNDNDYLLVVMDNIAFLKFELWYTARKWDGSLFIILCSHNFCSKTFKFESGLADAITINSLCLAI